MINRRHRYSHKHYLLTLLLVILAFNGADRLALGIVLQNVKADLALSDTQLGFLSGIAFALFYSIMGIPIARWADRGDRILIIALTTAIWSVMVSLCGVAGSFPQLLLIRIGVAVGEAGCIPPAHSLMADYFTRAERPRAAGIYSLGGPLAIALGYFFAGWLNQRYGWRLTFVLLGLPGVVLAALAWFTLREPRRMIQPLQADCLTSLRIAPRTHPNMRQVWETLWSNITFRRVLLAISIYFFFGNGINQWLPTLFIRSYGLTTSEIGFRLAVICGCGALIGTYLGAAWASRYAIHNERLQLRVMAVMFVFVGALSILMYLSRSLSTLFTLLALVTIGTSAINGPCFALLQTLVPERMRAVAIAVMYLFANLIGMGFGPLTAGVLSDVLQPWVGKESLRYALLILSPGYAWVAWYLWFAGTTVARDITAMQRATT